MKLKINQIIRSCNQIGLGKGLLRSLHLNSNSSDPAPEIIQVNETIIKDKLRDFSVPFIDGYTCFHVKNCSLCLHKNLTGNPDIFINKKTGFFLCEHCKVTGSWFMFNGLLKKSKTSVNEVTALKSEFSKYNKDSNWSDVVKKTSLLADLNDTIYSNIFKKFQLMKCSKLIVEKLQIRINQTQDVLYFPLFCSGCDIVGYKTLNLELKSSTVPRFDCPGFLISANGNNSAVVVAEIPDFFALLSQQLSYEILCLPYGSANLPQSALPFLETYNKIILWLGGANAIDSTGNFAKKLNNKRCYVVRPAENLMSARTAILKDENLKNVLNGARPTWHEAITTFGSLRDEVLAELQNNQEISGVSWKRFPALNKILKGHRRGELTVLTGPTGAGKTTFISEYSLDLAMQGVNTLWGSFEIKNSRLARIMLQQFAGEPLTDNLSKFIEIADRFEQLPIFFMTFHGQQKISTVMDAVEHCSYTYDIAHVIIDNVQFMIEVSPDSYQIDRFWKQDVVIQSFRSFASKNNCHVTLIMHPKKGMDGVDLSINSIFGGAKAAQEADNIFIIQNKKLSSSEGRKFLQISKNRYSGDLGAIPLKFDKASLSFSTKTSEAPKQNNQKQNLDSTSDDEYN